MLEETNVKTKDLVGEIINSVDIPALHETMADFYSLMNDDGVKKAGFDDEAETGMFRTYHLLVHLTDYGVSSEKIGKTQMILCNYSISLVPRPRATCPYAYTLLRAWIVVVQSSPGNREWAWII